jgi:hypothetical protein
VRTTTRTPPARTADRNLLSENYTKVVKKTEEKVQFIMTATPGVQPNGLVKPYLKLDSYQHEFETFRKKWLEYAPKLCDQNEGDLRDKVWKYMEREIREALKSKIGSERITQISFITTHAGDREDFGSEAV